MRIRGAAWLAAGLVAGHARAEPFVEIGTGAGWTTGRYEYRKPYPAWGTLPSGVLVVASGMDGPVGVLALEGGFDTSPTLALGARAEAELAVFDEGPALPYASIEDQLLFAASGLLAFRLDDATTIEGGAGWATAQFVASGQDIGAQQNVWEPEDVLGPVIGVGMGWSPGPFGVDLRARWMSLTGAHTQYRSLTLLAGATWGSRERGQRR